MGKKCLLVATIALLLVAFTTAAAAQDYGWTVRVRGISINPNDSSGVIDGTGSHISVDSKFVPEVDFSFRFNERFGMELVLATSRHDLNTSGGLIGGVSVGSVRVLPPTLTFQYYFPAGPHVIPYVGLGVNYTRFSGYDRSSIMRSLGVRTVDFDNSFGAAGQIGMDVMIDKHWLFNVDVKYIRISTKAKIRMYDGSTLGNVTVDVDPWVFGLGIGYRF